MIEKRQLVFWPYLVITVAWLCGIVSHAMSHEHWSSYPMATLILLYLAGYIERRCRRRY